MQKKVGVIKLLSHRKYFIQEVIIQESEIVCKWIKWKEQQILAG